MTDEAGVVVLDAGRLVAVDKPEGITSEQVAAARALKLVHRIDRLTSGLLLLARDARTAQRMQRALREGRVARTYLLVAHGVPREGALTSTLVRDRGDGLRGTGTGGKTASLALRALGAAPDGRATLCEATLITGRTHQIRIQLAEAGHPLVGDPVYTRDHRTAGLPLLAAERLLLHATRLAFAHPDTKAPVVVERGPPASFTLLCEALTGARPLSDGSK